MKNTNLFQEEIYQSILDRLNKLSPQSSALWGKMNIAQMLTHIQRPMEVAMGKKELKRSFIGFLFGSYAKKMLLKDKEFSKNGPTDPSFIVNDMREFDLEKQKFLNLFKEFHQSGVGGLTKNPHPFFGKLTQDEWLILQWKHLDHHLRQFGV